MDTIKRGLIFLQVVVMVIGVMAISILIRFPMTQGRSVNLELFSIYIDPFILYGYAVSIAFFVALYNAFKLLGYIGQNKVLSSKSVKTLKSIKFCAIVICISIVLAGLYIILLHYKEDDTDGFIAICIVTTFVSTIVATAASIFEKLLQNTLEHKAVRFNRIRIN